MANLGFVLERGMEVCKHPLRVNLVPCVVHGQVNMDNVFVLKKTADGQRAGYGYLA